MALMRFGFFRMRARKGANEPVLHFAVLSTSGHIG